MAFERVNGERALASVPANLFRGWQEVVGRLYISERRVVFESRLLRSWRESTDIPLGNIVDAYPWDSFWGRVGMEILLCDGVRHPFIVWDRDWLLDMIHVCKSGVVWGGATVSREPARPRPRPSPIRPADPAIRPGSSVNGTAHPNNR